MPQDGSNNYQYPPGTPGIPDTTIESEAYNAFLDDLVTNDLNIPRPIHRGGTGASTANAALTNLTGEKATQLVTDYSAHVWLPGSFYSATSATAPPVAGHAFAGIVYINEALVSPPTNANVTVEARDMTDGKLYIRQKTAGVWGAWVVQAGGVVDLDAAYVNVAGDTMTGALTTTALTVTGNTATGTLTATGNTTTDTLTVTNAATANTLTATASAATNVLTAQAATVSNLSTHTVLTLNKIGSGYGNSILAKSANVSRWDISLGGGDTESGGNAGSTFSISRWNDAGNTQTPVMAIDRATGEITMKPGGMTQSAQHMGLNIGYGTGTGSGGIVLRTNSDGLWPINFKNAADVACGSIQTTSTTTVYATSSSAELKEDLKSFDAGNIIDNTNVYNFAWKSTGERSYGVIAQQAVEVYPAAVTYREMDDWWGVDYSKYCPVMLQELKSLRLRVAELETKLLGGSTK